jgi:hypothetical protein
MLNISLYILCETANFRRKRLGTGKMLFNVE